MLKELIALINKAIKEQQVIEEPKIIEEVPIVELWKSQSYFQIEELVPQSTFIHRRDFCIELFDEKALRTLIEIRELFNLPMTVNNWKWNGRFNYRGYRPITYYKENVLSYSQHIFGRAFDFDVRGIGAEAARQQIIEWKREGKLKYLTTMELDVNWVHIDTRITENTNEDGLFLFKP